MNNKLATPLFLAGCLLIGFALAIGIRQYRKATHVPPPEVDHKPTAALPDIRAVTLPPIPVTAGQPDIAALNAAAADIAVLNATHAQLITPLPAAEDPAFAETLSQITRALEQHNLKLLWHVILPTEGPQPVAVGPSPQRLAAVGRRAQAANVDLLAIGFATPFQDDDPAAPAERIAEIRQHYKGRLARIIHLENVLFDDDWAHTDLVGIAGPWQLSSQPNPTDRQLRVGFENHIANLTSLAATRGKPLILFDLANATIDVPLPATVPVTPATLPADFTARAVAAGMVATRGERYVQGVVLPPAATPALQETIKSHWIPTAHP